MNYFQQGLILKKDKKIAKQKEVAAAKAANSDTSADDEPTQEQVKNWIGKECNNLKRLQMLIINHAPPQLQAKLLDEARVEHEVAEMGFLAFQAWHSFFPEIKPLPLNVFIMHYLFASPRHFTLTCAAWRLVKEDFDLTADEYHDVARAKKIVDAVPKLIRPLPFHY